jgi:hypothetical protein
MSSPRLTASKAAARFGDITGRRPHVSSVVRWITRGVRGRRLPAIRQGGVWLVSPIDVDRFVQFVSEGPSTTVSAAREAIVGAQLENILGTNWNQRGGPHR